MRNFTSFVFLTVGIFLIFFSAYLFWERNSAGRLAFATVPSGGVAAQNVVPTRLIIPRINIDVPIIPAQLSGQKWEATSQGVSYLSTSPLPGEVGNSIFYGHNWPNLLQRLPRVEPRDEVWVRLSTGEIRVFTVAYTTVVTPDQTHILAQSSEPRVTIYTCTGFLDTKRFVLTAIPKPLATFK